MKIPSTKNQITNKSQKPKFKISNKWSIFSCDRWHHLRKT
ncbi:hypothetical protein D1BOALGB6SA_566 [Olavius sp. associated proteobacterium Delta 1]|nr:hypothetical protein D1BOALGB6SA_566 [Olavius sp. associated proteobacterium Delta 1]